VAALFRNALPFTLFGIGEQTVDSGVAGVLGILCTGLTFYLTYRIIADEGATSAATVGYLLPVVSVLLGAIVLGEQLNPRVVAGMAVVLVGVGMTRRRRPTPSPLVVAES
jgi:drug/metabolite transporter (DMT)-like permease